MIVNNYINLFQYCPEAFEVVDLCHSAQVCKTWNTLTKDEYIWQKQFECEGIPTVKSTNHEKRNYRQDFSILFPITISGKMIASVFGEIVGSIPPIREEYFNILTKIDPFDESRSVKQSFVVLVRPRETLWTNDKENPMTLDDNENLVKDDSGIIPSRKRLEVPSKLKNLNIICSYLEKNKGTKPFFAKNSYTQVFNQCGDSSPNETAVYLMRKHVVNQSACADSFADQKNDVESKGFIVMGLRERAIYDAVTIRAFGACPDNRQPRWTDVRTSDTYQVGTDVYRACIGGYAPSAGVRIHNDRTIRNHLGVVPGLRIDASQELPPGTETWAELQKAGDAEEVKLTRKRQKKHHNLL